MSNKRDISYSCSVGCGACCKSVGTVLSNVDNYPEPWKTQIKKFPYKAKEDGSCEMLVDGKCSDYEDRPTICNISEMFKFFKKTKTRNEFYKDQQTACNEMITKQGLDKKFLINKY